MKIMQISEIKNLKHSELNNKITEVEKYLLELKFKQATRQAVKTHLFKKYKHMLAQMLTMQHKQQYNTK